MNDMNRIYADAIAVHSTVFGFTFDLGVKLPDGQPAIHTFLHMSPQMAKAVMMMLEMNLKAIEKDVGEIKLPNKFLAQIGRDDLMQYGAGGS